MTTLAARSRAWRKAEEKARREARERAQQDGTPKITTLSDKLAYALSYQTDEGMINYLGGISDERVQEILNGPADSIRDKIRDLLNILT